ncbi:hypothetical protein [Kitasatospora viridis]|uniref:Uncharacterized protein n=1 Tax=Kitasatospora viridis TaxID=281105 RepID=A0A561ULN3_9ACTN|nr:hypothetical protein [Kitasatospora viridis]TWG00291.1 hypothetical protein FHX73_114165 [Kitasatospora viridis]
MTEWPISSPPPDAWRLGRCHCCHRATLVAPGPVITTVDGGQVSIPWCLSGFERANRMLHRAAVRDANAERTTP